MDPKHVHPVPDYTGATKEERVERIQQIIRICRDHGYDYVFAGYGFMAEDASFVRAIENAGLRLHRPGLAHAGGRRRQGRGQADRDRERRCRSRRASNNATGAHAAAQVSRSRRAGAAGEGEGARRFRGSATAHFRSKPSRIRCSTAAYHAHIDLYTIEELAEHDLQVEAARTADGASGAALPPQGHRRRRRQGPAHLLRRRGTFPASCARSSTR